MARDSDACSAGRSPSCNEQARHHMQTVEAKVYQAKQRNLDHNLQVIDDCFIRLTKGYVLLLSSCEVQYNKRETQLSPRMNS